MREAFEMLVSELTEKYPPAYPAGGDWSKTVEYLYSEEGGLMDALYESLVSDGFQEPVTLSLEKAEGAPAILDGTRRVAIALNHGLLTLPARYGHPKLNSDTQYLTARVELSGGSSLTGFEEAALVNHLRSWRLNEKNWITSGLVVGRGVAWDVYFDTSDTSLQPLMEAEIPELLKRAFPQNTFKATIHFSPSPFTEEQA